MVDFNNLDFSNLSFVGFDELFNDLFMQKYTKFQSAKEFQDTSPMELSSPTPDDFKNYDVDKLDEFIKENTSFSSWIEMLKKASEEYNSK